MKIFYCSKRYQESLESCLTTSNLHKALYPIRHWCIVYLGRIRSQTNIGTNYIFSYIHGRSWVVIELKIYVDLPELFCETIRSLRAAYTYIFFGLRKIENCFVFLNSCYCLRHIILLFKLVDIWQVHFFHIYNIFIKKKNKFLAQATPDSRLKLKNKLVI